VPIAGVLADVFLHARVILLITDLEEAIKNNDLANINLFLMQLGKTGFINSGGSYIGDVPAAVVQ
jgi:hypothetical protein